MSRPSFAVTGTNNPNKQASVNWANGVANAFEGLAKNAKEFGASGDGVTDDTAEIQAALDTGAAVVILPPGDYLVSSTLSLQAGQTLMGSRVACIADPYRSTTIASRIKFRTASADTCIINEAGVFGASVEDLILDLNSADNFAIAFTSSYSNRIKNVTFDGTMGVGVYLNETYVCDISNPAFTGTTVKHACIYAGNVNQIQIDKLHTSITPADNAIAAVGVAIKGGWNSSIRDAVLQGCTIGIDIKETLGTSVLNPYFENAVCNFRTGAGGFRPSQTTLIGGTYGGPASSHPQYASRGPLIYARGGKGLLMENPGFYTTNVLDSAVYPILLGADCDSATLIAHNIYNSTCRAEVFREGNINVPISIIGNIYDDATAQEIILKSGGFGAQHYGLQIASDGTLSTVSWVPAQSSAVSSLLSGSFYEPTVP